MSLYNMLFGVTPATYFILPMLGYHPDEYPRFRDCFTADEEHPEYEDHIHIYTRTGGGNRDDYETENEWMRNIEGFVTDYDDAFDSTYASWVFKVPEKFQADFELLKNSNIVDTSDEYKELLKTTFPKLADQFDDLFKGEKND